MSHVGEANPSYKVKLISAVLLVRKVQLSPSVFLARAKALESKLAKYPIKRVVCKTYTIPAGNLDGNHEKLFTGQLPSWLVIGCVGNDAFNGTMSRIRSTLNITLERNFFTPGWKQATGQAVETQFCQAYMSLFYGTGKENRDEGNDIARKDYHNGYALYVFYLSPHLAEERHSNLAKQGTVRVELKFGTALPNTVTVVAYAEFENVIEIDRYRNIVYDFGS